MDFLGKLLVYTDEGTGTLTFAGEAGNSQQLKQIVGSITEPWGRLEIHARIRGKIVGNMMIDGGFHTAAFFEEHGACRGLMVDLREFFTEVEDVLDVRNFEQYK